MTEPPSPQTADRPRDLPPELRTGGGAMGDAVRRFDWSLTPLGPIGDWPQSLRTTVSLMLASRFPKCLVWGRDLTAIYNDAFGPILGDKPAPLGLSFRDIWAEAWDGIGPIADRAFAGEATFIEDFPLEIERGRSRELAYFTFCYSPVRDETGAVGGFMDTVIETTKTVEAKATTQLLNEELTHRVKNTLAMVSGIASQTLKGAADQDAVRAFDLRLAALADAHDLLVRESWTAAGIAEVIERGVSLQADASRLALSGPPLRLNGRGALSLALIVHELATNALKYGALASPAGRIDISWHVEDEIDGAVLALRWQESKGPKVTTPGRPGFGSRLIRMGLGGSGTTDLDFAPDGFVARFRTPLAPLVAD